MGCDIHLYVERKVKGVWKHVADELGPESGWGSNSWEPGRNYTLFGILADVRGRQFPCIAQPRGLPNDVSKFVSNANDRWEGDAHSQSYFLIKELLDVKNLTHPMTSYFHLKDYISYKETNEPQDWFDNYLPRGYTEISVEEMDRRVEQIAFSESEKFVTKIDWNMPYKSTCPHFWTTILDGLVALDPNPENVRIVFWFDN